MRPLEPIFLPEEHISLSPREVKSEKSKKVKRKKSKKAIQIGGLRVA
jgi:hypothetical protein